MFEKEKKTGVLSVAKKTGNDIQGDDNYIDVDFDDNYGDLKMPKEDLNKLSRSAIALIKHRGKLQLFNRKSVVTPINDINVSDISYKNIPLVKKFLTLGNNIISSRVTSAEYRRQRFLKKAVKRARELALIQYPGQKQKNDSGFNS
ncbi:MAG: small subunit ribosomal protein S18 [Candidatus Deianiraeaceae bacterium]|jgi:small subunit ribosomal protein S18